MENLIANRYRIDGRLGAGGMGVVYSAYDHLTAQTVALKRVSVVTDKLDFGLRTLTMSDKLANKQLGLALEFRTLAGLRHPHIISVMDYGFDVDKQPFFTMNLVENAQSLTDYARHLPHDQQIQLLLQVLQALSYLHRHGIIHRDLKPLNVLVGQDGSPKVMDFGLALNRSISLNEKQMGFGTVAYMAPEQLIDAPATVQSDLYATGVIIYEILAGRHPFDRQDLGTLLLQITSDEPDTSMFDDALQAVILRLMAKEAEDRYQNAEQVIAALCAAVGQTLPQEDTAIRESYLQAAKFVGRTTELEQLRTALDTTLHQKGSIWLIGGESGVGKSRLVDELHSQALVEGALVLRGQGAANGGLPFQLWRQLIRHLVLSVPLDALEASILKDIVPDISQLIGYTVADAPEITGEGYQQRLIQTIIALFRHLDTPCLLILEDLQWAVESLQPIRQMLESRESLPQLMVVGTYRNDERPNLPSELPGIQTISLPSLSHAEIAALSVSILGEVRNQQAIVNLLERETEGNCFFIIEVMRTLAEEAGYLSDIGTVTIAQGISTNGMRAILQRRIEQIPIHYHPLLKFAAVAGRQIELPLLKHALPETDIEDWLYTSHYAAVLHISNNQWQFAHDKLREAMVLALTDSEQQTIHQQVAVALEEIHPNDSSYHDILMQHWSSAGNWEKEIYYSLRIIEHKTLVTAEYEQASQLAKRILARLSADDPRRLSLLNLLALSYLRQTELEEAAHTAEELKLLAKQYNNDNSLALSLHHLGVIAYFHSDHPTARAYFQESIAVRWTSGKVHRATPSLNNLGAIAVREGAYHEARTYFLESLELSQSKNNIDQTAWCLFFLGWVSRYLGDYEVSRNYSQASLAMRRASGDLFGIAWSLRELSDLAMVQARYEEADNHVREGMETSQAIGDKWGIVGCQIILGTIEAKQGKYADARNTFQQSLQISRVLDDKFCIASALCGLAFVKLKLNDSNAQATLHEALVIARELHAVPLMLEIIVGCAQLLFQQGVESRAAEYISLTQHHPAYHATIAMRVADVMPMLVSTLDAETFQSAEAYGAQLDLETVVVKILEEFAERSNPV